MNVELSKIELAHATEEAVGLLKKLIQTPSFSREEDKTASLLADFFKGKGLDVHRNRNNVWVEKINHPDYPYILLNSHHDTVKPAKNWETDPFTPLEEQDKIIGLGSNDAGGSLVALIATFLLLKNTDQPFNLMMAATAEEEISGKNGIAHVLPQLPAPALAVVGEPTGCQMAIAEKGLMVLDCEAKGKAGHAAREEGINSIYLAMQDIDWFKNYRFSKKSELLGEVKMSVTQIEAGSQHNVVPESCRFVVDVRSTECYSNEEIHRIIQQYVSSKVIPRSYRLNSSGIPLDHPVVQRGITLGLEYFGSPTLSDQALMPFKSLKIGPGESARSHTAGEFIEVSEIAKGIETYYRLVSGLKL